MGKNRDYILWLPSWYPNEYEKSNGDFIKRHALAASLYCRIVVFHFFQGAAKYPIKNEKIEIEERGNLKELIVYPKFSPTGINLYDKLLYNFYFYKKAKRYLINYFKEFGLPSLVHVHVPMKAGNIALWIKKKYGVEYIISEQSSCYMPSSPDSFYNKPAVHKLQVKNIFRNAKLVSNVSGTLGSTIKELFKLNPVITIHNTVDTHLFYFKPADTGVFTFIHVSALGEQKNIGGILRAFSQFLQIRSDWQLKIVGPFTHHIERQIETLKLKDHVRLLGELSYSNVAQAMQQSNVFVLFSRHENFPCVVVEALCCGLPVIASNVAGVCEAVNCTNGLVVASEDEKELTNALNILQSNYLNFDREVISKNASAMYNYGTVGNQFFNLYRL